MVYFQVRRPYKSSRSGITRKRSAAPSTGGSNTIRRRTTGRGRSMSAPGRRSAGSTNRRPTSRASGRPRRTGGKY